MTAIVPLLPLNWRGRLKTSFMCILFLLVCLCCCIFFLVVHSIYFIHSWHDIACFNQPSIHLMPRRWQCSRGLINYLLTSRSHWRHNSMEIPHTRKVPTLWSHYFYNHLWLGLLSSLLKFAKFDSVILVIMITQSVVFHSLGVSACYKHTSAEA